jgi:predicted PurR-regulated permease PerM
MTIAFLILFGIGCVILGVLLTVACLAFCQAASDKQEYRDDE